MWSEGVISIPAGISGKSTAVHYWVKHYQAPSKYGINNGHISKVMLKINGRIVCHYDRGWDVPPICKDAEIALKLLLYEYDGRHVE